MKIPQHIKDFFGDKLRVLQVTRAEDRRMVDSIGRPRVEREIQQMMGRMIVDELINAGAIRVDMEFVEQYQEYRFKASLTVIMPDVDPDIRRRQGGWPDRSPDLRAEFMQEMRPPRFADLDRKTQESLLGYLGRTPSKARPGIDPMGFEKAPPTPKPGDDRLNDPPPQIAPKSPGTAIGPAKRSWEK